MLKLLSRYTLIGMFNVFIHFSVFFTLLNVMLLSQMIANLVAFFIASAFSFVANAKWTFNQDTNIKRYFLFFLMLGSIATLTGFISDQLQWHPLLTLVLFALINLILGFLGSHYLVFRKSKSI